MTLNTVKRIGPVLELFTPEKPEWRMTDIARALGEPKSSAHSLVSSLAEIGLLSVAPSGRYRLGLRIFTLSERMRTSTEVLHRARPVMQELAQSSRETVLLSMLDRTEAVYLDRAEGTHPMVRLVGVRPGARVPLHSTACGKVLLAYGNPSETQRLLQTMNMRRFTARTITDPAELEDALVNVRARGYALDQQEIVSDLSCAASPIFDEFGTVIAALSTAMPAYRFPNTEEGLINDLNEAAAAISEVLVDVTETAVFSTEDTPVPA